MCVTTAVTTWKDASNAHRTACALCARQATSSMAPLSASCARHRYRGAPSATTAPPATNVRVPITCMPPPTNAKHAYRRWKDARTVLTCLSASPAPTAITKTSPPVSANCAQISKAASPVPTTIRAWCARETISYRPMPPRIYAIPAMSWKGATHASTISRALYVWAATYLTMTNCVRYIEYKQINQ